MGDGLYEVIIVSAKAGRQMKGEWRVPELLKSVNWMKRMNAQGADIYLRLIDGAELLLVDRLNAEALKDLRRQGLMPAVAVETSPGHFQAWVKLSKHPLPEALRKNAVSGLARVVPKVGQDGRLAGFTNHQAEANREGRQPYVMAHEATGTVAPAALPYLNVIERHLRELASVKRHVDAEKARRIPKRDRGVSR